MGLELHSKNIRVEIPTKEKVISDKFISGVTFTWYQVSRLYSFWIQLVSREKGAKQENKSVRIVLISIIAISVYITNGSQHHERLLSCRDCLPAMFSTWRLSIRSAYQF